MLLSSNANTDISASVLSNTQFGVENFSQNGSNYTFSRNVLEQRCRSFSIINFGK